MWALVTWWRIRYPSIIPRSTKPITCRNKCLNLTDSNSTHLGSRNRNVRCSPWPMSRTPIIQTSQHSDKPSGLIRIPTGLMHFHLQYFRPSCPLFFAISCLPDTISSRMHCASSMEGYYPCLLLTMMVWSWDRKLCSTGTFGTCAALLIFATWSCTSTTASCFLPGPCVVSSLWFCNTSRAWFIYCSEHCLERKTTRIGGGDGRNNCSGSAKGKS